MNWMNNCHGKIKGAENKGQYSTKICYLSVIPALLH